MFSGNLADTVGRDNGARYYVRPVGFLRRAYPVPESSEPVGRSGFDHACEPGFACHESAPVDVRA